jgi:hypothetical protein
MILPTKHLPPNRAIISVSSEIYSLINKRSTISSVWSELQERHKSSLRIGEISYDWFILALDFLYIIGIIEHKSGLLKKVKVND